jgi:hypothetical protein
MGTFLSSAERIVPVDPFYFKWPAELEKPSPRVTVVLPMCPPNAQHPFFPQAFNLG